MGCKSETLSYVLLIFQTTTKRLRITIKNTLLFPGRGAWTEWEEVVVDVDRSQTLYILYMFHRTALENDYQHGHLIHLHGCPQQSSDSHWEHSWMHLCFNGSQGSYYIHWNLSGAPPKTNMSKENHHFE